MKQSDLKEYIKEEIISVLSEESAEEINNKTNAQKEFNNELEKTKELVGEETLKNMGTADIEEMGYEEGENIFSRMRGESSPDLRAYFGGLKQGFLDSLGSYSLNEDMDDDEADKAASKGTKKSNKDPLVKNQEKLSQNAKEIKSVLNKFKKAKGAEKEKYVKELKALGKIKTELEKLSLAENKLLKENIKSASELLANKEEFDKVVDELAQNIISNGSWDGQHPNSLFKAKGEDFIHPSYVIPSSPPESKDEIAKMFGVSIEDIKTEEEGPSTNISPGVNFIIMGDSQKIKSIAHSKGIKAEDNEGGGVKIFGKISTEDWNAYSMLEYDVHMKVRDLKKQLAK